MEEKNNDLENSGKMSIYEYEQKYVRRQNVKGAKVFLRIFAAILGVFLFVLLLLVSLRVYDFNQYAGYATGAVCLLLYIFVFVVPLIKIIRAPYFMTNVNAQTASSAQRHNRKVRQDLADKMINFTAKVEAWAGMIPNSWASSPSQGTPGTMRR